MSGRQHYLCATIFAYTLQFPQRPHVSTFLAASRSKISVRGTTQYGRGCDCGAIKAQKARRESISDALFSGADPDRFSKSRKEAHVGVVVCAFGCGLRGEQDNSPSLLMPPTRTVVPSITFLLFNAPSLFPGSRI